MTDTKATEDGAMRAGRILAADLHKDVQEKYATVAARIIRRETRLAEKEAALKALIICMEGDGDRWRHCRDLDTARDLLNMGEPPAPAQGD